MKKSFNSEKDICISCKWSNTISNYNNLKEREDTQATGKNGTRLREIRITKICKISL